jgi:predicted NBD/HSP70 family sugar kinase
VASGRDGIGQRSETVRRANLSAIVREIHDHGALSRSELVARTGLTRSAIRGLIAELVACGLVAEEPAERLGTPGRPSPRVRLDAGAAVVLSFELAVDSFAAALVGLGGKVLEMVRVDRPRGHYSLDEIVADLVDLARTVTAARPLGDALVGIGVAVAGVVRRSDGVVSMAPNLGWRDVPLGEHLGAALADALGETVPMSIANEADLGALAEHRRGAAIGVDNLLFIHGEVGVGGGMIVDGHPLTGVAGYGGEVGHLPVNPDGRPCRCGSAGCWETEVGEDALLVRAGRPAGGGRRAVDAVLRDAGAGDKVALAAFDHVGRWLGIGLAGMVNVLNPGCIVLGGVFGRWHPFVIGAIEAELDRRALPAARALVRVVPATLGARTSLLGAAELAFEPLLVDPAALACLRDAHAELASA